METPGEPADGVFLTPGTNVTLVTPTHVAVCQVISVRSRRNAGANEVAVAPPQVVHRRERPLVQSQGGTSAQ